MLHDAIYDLLDTLASGKVYPGIAPENVSLPYIVHFQVTNEPTQSDDGDEGLDRYRYQVSCFAESYRAVKTLANQVRDILDDYEGTVLSMNLDSIRYIDEGYINEDMNVHHIPIDFEIAIKT